MANLDLRNRSPENIRLPDYRQRLTRIYDVLNYIPKSPAKILAEAWLDWGTQDAEYTDLRLVAQSVSGQNGPFDEPCATPPILTRVYEEIPANSEIIVGEPGINYDQYARKSVVINYLQFSAGTSVYSYVVGTTTAPAPNTDSILQKVESTNDGTLIRTTRTFIDSGQLSQTDETKFDGALLLRTVRSLNEIPATPANYTLVSTSTEFIEGLPVYTYQFACGSITAGAGGVISTDTAYSQSDDTGTTGVTVQTIKYISAPGVAANPIATPSGFTLIGIDETLADGFKVWTGRYARGQGIVVSDTLSPSSVLRVYHIVSLDAAPSAPSPTIGGSVVLIDASTRLADGYEIFDYRWAEGNGLAVDESSIQIKDALVVYRRVQLGGAPTTPSATIGGTVTLFESTVRQEEGYAIYDYRWSEGDGQSSITTDGEPDGALVYTVVTTSAAAATPAYPGSGTAYLVRLNQEPKNGYFQNTAVYKKPPATVGFRKMKTFLMPGLASFSGAPVLYNLSPPVSMEILATVTVSYDTSQDTTAPFTVSAYARLNTSWIPYTNPGIAPTPGSPPADTTTGPPQQDTQSLGGYLAGASGISDNDQFFNGVFVATYSATLAASTPSSRPTGATTIEVDNDPYLTATDGTVVFRRTVTTYSF